MIDLPELPPRIAALPRDHRGYPVPWFATWRDGKPDFRVADGAKVVQAVEECRCWICGQQLGTFRTFVAGPLLVVNRCSGEPPSHKSCAEFAVKACPFMVKQTFPRVAQEKRPGEARYATAALTHNPGVAVTYTARAATLRRKPDGILFFAGDPTEVQWWAAGRNATREEAAAGLERSMEQLRPMLQDDDDPSLLEAAYQAALKLLPAYTH